MFEFFIGVIIGFSIGLFILIPDKVDAGVDRKWKCDKAYVKIDGSVYKGQECRAVKK